MSTAGGAAGTAVCRVLAVLTCAIVAVGLGAAPAFAHDELVGGAPAGGSPVPSAPDRAVPTFAEPTGPAPAPAITRATASSAPTPVLEGGGVAPGVDVHGAWTLGGVVVLLIVVAVAANLRQDRGPFGGRRPDGGA